MLLACCDVENIKQAKNQRHNEYVERGRDGEEERGRIKEVAEGKR